MNCFHSQRSYWYDKNIYLSGLFAFVLLSAGWAPAVAQEGDSAEDAQEEQAAEEEGDEEALSFFESTNITATGIKVSTFSIPAPVIVIPAERIQEILPDNAADLLRNEPGVDVNGTGPNQARPIIRGQRGHRVLFLQDGLRMNNARRQTDFGEITGLVDVANVETLELVRGAGSVLYGSDAIGGVMNLITKVPPIGAGNQVTGSFGVRFSDADEQLKMDASVRGKSGKFSYGLAATMRNAEDYDAPSGTFGDITLNNSVTLNDSGVEDDSFNLYLGYNVNDQTSLFFRADRYGANDAGFGFVDPAIFNDPVLNRIFYPFQDFERYTVGYSAAGLDSALANTFDLKVYSQGNERDNGFFLDINIGPAFGPGSGPDGSVVIDSLIFSDIETEGFRAEVTKAINDKNLLTYGVEYFEDDVFNARESTTTTTLRAFFPIAFVCGPPGAMPVPPTFHFECVFPSSSSRPSSPNATNSGQGIFIQDSIYPTEKLSATIGARFAKSETEANPTPGWDTTGLDFSDDDIVGALSLVYGVNDNVNLVGSYATAFRAPNIIERLFNGLTPEGLGFQILNTELTSEDSTNTDFGVKYQGRNAYFEAIYFETEIDDAIVQHSLTDAEKLALPADVQEEIDQVGVEVVVQQRNADTLTIDGIEIAGAYRFDNGFSVGGNFTSLDGEAEVGQGDPTGSTFSEKTNVFARYDDRKTGRWWVEYRVRRNGDEDQQLDPDATIPPVGAVLPSFTIHDLSAGFLVHEGDRFVQNFGLVITNLTDELYSEFSNASFFRPQPERRIAFSYRVRGK